MITPPKIETHKSFIGYKQRTETNYIVVHCSATQCKQAYDWKSIDQMHRLKGWLSIGYHYVIKADGTIQEGRPRDAIGAHASGHNSDSVGICLIGGCDIHGKSVDNFTKAQKSSLKELLDYLRYIYYEQNPKVLGHRDFTGVQKDCPCFDVRAFYCDGARYAYYCPDDSKFKAVLKLSKYDFESYNNNPKEGELVRVS